MSTRQPTAERITAAILRIVADDGLDHATVREVARVAGVSIGAVQHHFPTKEAMLAAAFAEVVRRVRERLGAIRFDEDVRHNVQVVLEELLPLDRRREQEAKVQLAFSVRAVHDPALATTQRAVLGELHGALSHALASSDTDTGNAPLAAHVALAVVDGLTLHALSTRGWLTRQRMTMAVHLVLETLLGERPDR